jgi:hypothetical protein
MTTRAELAAFFRHFSADADRDALAGCFADAFLVGDASGARPVPRDAFLSSLPKRAELFARAGIGAPELDRLSFDDLDERYLWARTEWTAPRAEGGEIRLIASYLMHRQENGDLCVVVYLNHKGL